MTIQVINTGTGPNSGNGDSIRTAFSKVNANFAELATIATGTNFDLLAIPSNLVPDNDQTHNLGSASKQWDKLYVGPDGVTINGNALTINGSGNITINGTPFQSGFASTSSLINGSAQVHLDAQGSLHFPPSGILQSYVSSATTATIIYINDIMLDSPVMVHTVGLHNLSNSDLVKITGIGTTVELNNKYHYVQVIDPNTINLYEDAALSVPVNGTGYTPYLGLSNAETFTNTGTTGRSNVISQFLDVHPAMTNIRVNWYASGAGIDQPDPNATSYTVIKQPGFLNYLVDGTVNKPLYLQRGNTYYLNVFAPPHPVYIQTTGAGYNPADVYSLGVTNQGTGDGIITFTVPLNAPDVLYYQCQHHAGMVGPIYISNGVGTSKVLAINTQTTSSRVLYQFILDNTWPLVNQASYAFTGTFQGGGQLEFQDVKSRLTVRSNEKEWIFNPDGKLVIPAGGDIERNGLSVLSSLVGRTFVVTESQDGLKYVFNGTPDSPDIVLIRGLTYYFEANLPGHPFWIQTTPGAFDINSVYTDGIINNGVEVGTLTFTVPENAADILYYACEYHPGMTGQFLIRNLGDEIDLTKINTSVNPNISYIHDLGSTSSHWRNLYARTGFFGVIPSWIAINPLSVFTSEVDGYSQIQAQNQSTGTSASTDFVATADSGNDSTDYIDLGINGSNFSSNRWTISGGRDGYLYASGNNLTVGTDSSGTTVKIHTGGTLEKHVVATFNAAGTNSTSTTTGALTVAGGIGVAGNIVSHNLIPAENLKYDLGSTSSQWHSLYVGTGTIYIGGVALGVSQNNYITVDGNPIITVSTSGTLTVQGNTDVVLGSVIISDTAPDATTPGSQWFNSREGRIYIAYSGQWVDASPSAVPDPETYLGNITIDGSTINMNGSTLSINNDGILLVNGSEVTNNNSTYIPANPLDWSNSLSVIVSTFGEGLDQLAGRMTVVETSGGGGGTANGWQLTSSTSVVSLASNGVLTLPNGATIFDNDGPGGGWLSIAPANASTGQALVIYPTVADGNHIHLTANGNDTDLYLGNDSQYVKVDHSGTIVIGTYSTATTTSTWTFGTDGSTLLPDGNLYFGSTDGTAIYNHGISVTSGTQYAISSAGNDSGINLQWFGPGTYPTRHWAAIRVNAPEDASTGSVVVSTGAMNARNNWVYGQDGVLTLSTASTILGNSSDPNVYIETATTATTSTWTFGTDGVLTLPAATPIIKGGGTGTDVTVIASTGTNTSTWVFGADGTLTLPGGSGVAGGFIFGAPGEGAGVTNGGTGYQQFFVQGDGAYVQTSVNNSGTVFNTWQFGTDGNLTLPQGGVITSDGVAAVIVKAPSGSQAVLANNAGYNAILAQDQDVRVATSPDAGSTFNTWNFGTDGDLTLPGQLLFPEGTTFYNNGISVSSGTQYGTSVQGNTSGINQYWFADGTMPTRKWAAVRVNSPENASTGSVVVSTGAFNSRNNWIFAHDGSTVLPENTLKGYCFTATNAVFNYLPQAGAFYYTDNPILRSIATIGGAWYIKGPGLVGWKQITGVQDNGDNLIIRIGSGNTPLPDGSEFNSGGHNPTSPDLVYTISQYLELDIKAADKTWTFDSTGTLILPTGGDIVRNGASVLGGGAGGPVFQLTSSTAVVSLASNGTLTFPNNDLTISSYGSVGSLESRIWTTDSDITVYRNGRDGYAVIENEVTVYAGNGQIAKFVPTGLEIASGKSLKFPDATVQTTAYTGTVAYSNITGAPAVVNRTTGSWILATGANTVSITVPPNGNYQMWVSGTCDYGIVEWNATVNVSNTNVPAIGSQYGWYYAAGNALVLTSIPNQIIGTAGVISSATGYTGTISNVFSFGITNNSGSTQTAYWGYTTL